MTVQPVRLLQPNSAAASHPPKQSPAIETKRKRKLVDDLTPRIDAFLAKASSQKKQRIASEETSSSPPPKALLTKDISTEVAFSVAKCREAAQNRRPERLLTKEGIVGALDEANLVVGFLFNMPSWGGSYPKMSLPRPCVGYSTGTAPVIHI